MSQIKTKFIEDNAVNDLKIRLRNNLALRGRNAADSADIDLIKLSSTDVFEVLRELSLTGNKIINLQDPTASQDAATKAYVDMVASGLSDPKDAVRLATTAPLPASTYANGTGGDGATITADVNGAIGSIDGVSPSIGDRVLVKDQASAEENGIYVVTVLGDAGNPFVLTRSGDANSDAEITQGMFVPVAEGATNAAQGYLLTSTDPITVGTSTLNFTQFGEVVIAGSGLIKTGNTISIDEGDGLTYSGNQLVISVDDDLVNGSTKISAGSVASTKSEKELFTLTGTDVSNQYIDLGFVASMDSIAFNPGCGPIQIEGVDYTVSYTGGTGGKTRISFIGDLATGGPAALVATDVFEIKYKTLDWV